VAVAAAVVPLERLHLETDAPWCEIRRTHASHKHVVTTWPAVDPKKYAPDKVVKGRCEPCHIVQVAEVVAGARGLSVAEVAAAALANSRHLFFRK
jgi:TatD DNase family protein